MRKLAREAVIFMLLGLLLTAVSIFAIRHYDEAESIQGQREALKKNCDLLAKGPAGATVLEDKDTIEATIAECGLVFGTDPNKGGYSPRKVVTITSDSPSLPGKWSVEPQPDGTVNYHPADLFEKQQQDMLTEGTRIKNLKVDNSELVLTAAIAGLYGFVGGFCIWLFYRLVRFAIKG